MESTRPFPSPITHHPLLFFLPDAPVGEVLVAVGLDRVAAHISDNLDTSTIDGLVVKCYHVGVQVKIEYSRHARNRMRLRKISKAQVEEVLIHPERVLPDPDKPARLIAHKHFSGRLIEVIHVREQTKIVVVTVI